MWAIRDTGDLRCHHTYHGVTIMDYLLRWCHNGHDGVSNHQPHDCLLNRLFGRRSKKKSKLRVTGLCAGNSPGTAEFPAQMASNAENVSIWWCHHECCVLHNPDLPRAHLLFLIGEAQNFIKIMKKQIELLIDSDKTGKNEIFLVFQLHNDSVSLIIIQIIAVLLLGSCFLVFYRTDSNMV